MFDYALFGFVNAIIYLRHIRQVIEFRWKVGYFPNVALPNRYNEKMFWRKCFDRNPLFVVFSDKLATKLWSEARCPELDVLKPLWSGQDCTEIPYNLLQSPIVIKANHGSGWNFFWGRGEPGQSLPVRHINGWLKRTFGQRRLEWTYRFAKKILFCERMLEGESGEQATDLCVHAGNEKPYFLEVVVANKTSRQQKAYFRTDGTRYRDIERLSNRGNDPASLPDDFVIPDTYRAALEHVRILSQGVDYARFDFLTVEGKLYGGEITVFPGSGLTGHRQFEAYNAVMDTNWDISNAWFFGAANGKLLTVYANALHRHLTEGRISA